MAARHNVVRRCRDPVLDSEATRAGHEIPYPRCQLRVLFDWHGGLDRSHRLPLVVRRIALRGSIPGTDRVRGSDDRLPRSRSLAPEPILVEVVAHYRVGPPLLPWVIFLQPAPQ